GFYEVQANSVAAEIRSPRRWVLKQADGDIKACTRFDVGTFWATREAGGIKLTWDQQFGLSLRVRPSASTSLSAPSSDAAPDPLSRFRLPAEYSRIACACSGTPPDVQNEWLTYHRVPRNLAQDLARLLGVELVLT
ncbi:MAG: hypothetical protein WCH97_05415, partial [Actinomycetes bacterium]